MENTKTMKFKDAPIGARFHFIGDNTPKDVYVKINEHNDGLIVKWNGNVEGYQSHCCWLDEENGIDFETKIEVIECTNDQTTQLREENERLKIGILKVRDELSKNDVPSAYHELYRLANPTFKKKEPWTEFEQLLKEQ